MSITLTFGWWLAPAVITAGAFGVAWARCMMADQHAGMFAPSAAAILAIFLFPLAAVVSLAAWLVWALFA